MKYVPSNPFFEENCIFLIYLFLFYKLIHKIITICIPTKCVPLQLYCISALLGSGGVKGSDEVKYSQDNCQRYNFE